MSAFPVKDAQTVIDELEETTEALEIARFKSRIKVAKDSGQIRRLARLEAERKDTGERKRRAESASKRQREIEEKRQREKEQKEFDEYVEKIPQFIEYAVQDGGKIAHAMNIDFIDDQYMLSLHGAPFDGHDWRRNTKPGSLNPKYLRGTSKMVFDFCKKAGLRPFLDYYRHDAPINWRLSSPHHGFRLYVHCQ